MADAIYETILPRTATDALPQSDAGIVAASADRLDSLLGLAAAGCLPSASADPFGMRRIVYGLLQTLIASDTRGSLRHLVAEAAAVQPIAAGADVQGAVLEFVRRRLEQFIVDQGACRGCALFLLVTDNGDLSEGTNRARKSLTAAACMLMALWGLHCSWLRAGRACRRSNLGR